ncbi:MAG: hypothetical protein NVS2B16_02740 [Chloroflexota bacterium]
MPGRLHEALERWLGTGIVSAVDAPDGFSPGPAARVQVADGRQVFVKAVGPELNPDTPDMHRQEARVVGSLPANVPAPHLLWQYDEGATGWIMLVFEHIEGEMPAQPWQRQQLERVLAALDGLSTLLTPAPIDLGSAALKIAKELNGWRRMVHTRPEHLDAWSRHYLHELADLETSAIAAVDGDTVLHFDLRADNILLTPHRVYIVDWPHACIGAPWLDIVLFAPSVAMQDGPDPEALLARRRAARSADPDAVTAAIAAFAGYLTHRSFQPSPPGLPTLRSFQAAQGAIARRWLARRTGWR